MVRFVFCVSYRITWQGRSEVQQVAAEKSQTPRTADRTSSERKVFIGGEEVHTEKNRPEKELKSLKSLLPLI